MLAVTAPETQNAVISIVASLGVAEKALSMAGSAGISIVCEIAYENPATEERRGSGGGAREGSRASR